MNSHTESSRHLEEKNRTLLKKTLKTFFVLAVLLLSFWLGLQKGKGQNAALLNEPYPLKDTVVVDDASKKLDFGLFWKTWNVLKEKYVDSEKLDAKKMMYGAIKGMLASTGDPYTNFFDPEENKKFNEEISGTFEGIGAEMGIKKGIITIIAPLSGTPAERAGLKAGDMILKINNESTEQMTIDEAVSKIKGPKNTEVTLNIFRNGDQETKDIVIKRDVINVKSVILEHKGGVAYLKISRFGDDTEKEFDSAVNDILQKKSKGLIIDLRNNPGGYLETAVRLASRMLSKDDIVVIEEDGDGQQKKMLAKGGDVLSGMETVVLINEGSASASEILAGALKDNRENVTLVGRQSFGKGSVQEFISLPQDAAVKITVAKWLTPNSHQINEVGIKPDVEVELKQDDFESDRDPQLDKALEMLKEKLKLQ